MVPDVDAACERFASLGVEFIKKPTDGTITFCYLLRFYQFILKITKKIGKMKGIAFIKDPDGYWIEIFNNMMNF